MSTYSFNIMKILSLSFLIITLVSSSTMAQKIYPSFGEVIIEDPAMQNLISADAKVEVLASGFKWSEGPLWIRDGGYLLFSDVPKNTIYK